jgi:RimJ/RimL family protein N-acetyltransferase
LHPISCDPEDQKKFIIHAINDPNTYYFKICSLRLNRPEGLICLYNYENDTNESELGRWILAQESMAALESIFLGYTYGFEILGYDKISTRTNANNKHMVSFHDSFGIKNKKKLNNYFLINGKRISAIEHSIYKSEWYIIKGKIEPNIIRLANKLNDDSGVK